MPLQQIECGRDTPIDKCPHKPGKQQASGNLVDMLTWIDLIINIPDYGGIGSSQ